MAGSICARLSGERGSPRSSVWSMTIGVARCLRQVPVPHWLGAGAFYLALTLWVFRHTVTRITEVIPGGADIFSRLWNAFWVHHSVARLESPYMTDWVWWPESTSLIYHSYGFSGILPWAWLVGVSDSISGVILAHNATVLSSFVLTSLAVYLLAYQETKSRPAALAAGVLFGFSAYRLHMCGWSHLLSFQYVVVFLLLLLRALRGSSLATIGAGVAAACVAYNSLTHVLSAFLLALAMIAAEGPLRRIVIRRLASVSAVALLLLLPLLWEFYQSHVVRQEVWPTASFSVAPLLGGLNPLHLVPAHHPMALLLGGLNPLHLLLPAHHPSALAGWLETILPGGLAELDKLAAMHWIAGLPPTFVRGSLGYFTLFWIVVGLLRAESRRQGRRWWVAGLIALVLSLGLYPHIGSKIYTEVPLPYWLLHQIPGISMSRTPYRLIAPALLCLSVFAAISIRDVLALVTRRWEFRPAGRIAISVCIVLVATAERAAYAPSAQVLHASAFSRQLAHDPGEYAIAYYPPAVRASLDDKTLWDQVAHRKRLLIGRLARIPLGHVLDPGKRPLMERDPRSTEERVEALGELFLEPRYRIKFLVVWRPGPRGQAGTHAELRRLLAKRYPTVARESPQPYGQLFGFLQRDVYYVGGELFHRDLSRLLHDGEKLRVQACSAAGQDFQLEKQGLRRAWAEFRMTTAQWERKQAEFSAAQDLIDSIDSPRCP